LIVVATVALRFWAKCAANSHAPTIPLFWAWPELSLRATLVASSPGNFRIGFEAPTSRLNFVGDSAASDSSRFCRC